MPRRRAWRCKGLERDGRLPVSLLLRWAEARHSWIEIGAFCATEMLAPAGGASHAHESRLFADLPRPS